MKKGFTLIELLGVIIVLAVIVLIVTPIVTGIINSSKISSAKAGAKGYATSVENAFDLDDDKKLAGLYTIGTDGNVTSGSNVLDVDIKGVKPDGGKLCVDSDGKVYSYSINISGRVITSQNDTIDIGTSIVNITCN